MTRWKLIAGAVVLSLTACGGPPRVEPGAVKHVIDNERAKAKAEAIRISRQADFKAAEYYTVFGKNRKLAIFHFQLKELMDSLKEKTSLILDQQTPPFNLLNGVESDGSAVTAKP